MFLRIWLKYGCFTSVLMVFYLSLPCFASGFRIHLENASDLGNAYAGGAALTDDASVNAFNAAGLSFLHKQQFVMSLAGVSSHSTFDGTATAPNLIFGPSFTAMTRAKSNNSGFIPAIYYAYPLNAKWDIGLSVNEPFGLGLDFGENANLRYTLINAYQVGIDIGPSLSYRINDHLAIGAGPNFQHYSASSAMKINTEIDMGFPFFFSFSDSRSDVDASGWGYGGHIGLLYALSNKTRLGVSYRSKIFNRLEGKSHFESGAIAPFLTTSDHFQLTFSVPAISMLSVSQQLTQKWAVLGTIDYTEWSAFNYVRAYHVAQLGSTINVITPEKFHNTFHAALAANYQMNEQWLLRLGMGYNEDPVRPMYRSILFPNGHTVAIAAGAKYVPNKKIAIDLGYLHSFIHPVNVDYTDPLTLSNLTGKLQTEADIVGAQLVWNIC